MRECQIVYVSRAGAGTSDADVRAIAVAAARANAAAEVTALLFYDGRRFLQALEGERDAVEAVLRRIEADPRHDSLQRIADRVIDRPEFGGVPMAYERIEAAGTPDLLDRIKAQMETVTDPALKAAFIGFARLGSTPQD